MKNELFRKFFHLLFFLCIPLIIYTSVRITQAILVFFGLCYYLFEQMRLKNIKIPIVSFISKVSLRPQEQESIAFAPLTLALGIVLVTELYFKEAAILSIIAITVGDSAAALIGKSVKGWKLLWNKKKTISGMCANFLSVYLVCLFWVNPSEALTTAIVSAIVESLDLEHVDNLMVPLTVGASLYLL